MGSRYSSTLMNMNKLQEDQSIAHISVCLIGTKRAKSSAGATGFRQLDTTLRTTIRIIVTAWGCVGRRKAPMNTAKLRERAKPSAEMPAKPEHHSQAQDLQRSLAGRWLQELISAGLQLGKHTLKRPSLAQSIVSRVQKRTEKRKSTEQR